MSFFDAKIRVDSVSSLLKFHTTVDVLRLDMIHPVISGNKWFKLKYFLKEAEALHKKYIVTFGGAFSNHIIATAAACKEFGFKSIGIIRGEKSAILSHTLQDAINYGMDLFFASREEYKQKKIPQEIFSKYREEHVYIIPEGGYGPKGIEGIKETLQNIDSSYTHIVAAVGTGTTLAGLLEGSLPHQKIIGISVLKNNFSLEKEIESLIVEENKNRMSIIHEYHFGGYAKHTNELIDFINEFYKNTAIPSDFVYTGKLFFSVNNLIHKNYFPPKSKLLIIHSGGLQGNRSLSKGTLIF